MPRVAAKKTVAPKTPKAEKKATVAKETKPKKVQSLAAKLNAAMYRTITKDIEETLPAMIAEAFEVDSTVATAFVQEYMQERFGKVSRTSGYLVFSNENRAVAKKNLPDGAKMGAISKELGKMWKLLPKEKQAEWNAKAKKINADKASSRSEILHGDSSESEKEVKPKGKKDVAAPVTEVAAVKPKGKKGVAPAPAPVAPVVTPVADDDSDSDSESSDSSDSSDSDSDSE